MVEEASRQFVAGGHGPRPAPAARRAARARPVRALAQWGQRPGGCFFVGASAELDDRPGPPRDALVQACKDWIDELAKAARIAVSEGHFRADLDPEQFAFEVYGIMLGAHMFFRFLREPVRARPCTRGVRTPARHGASARPARPLTARCPRRIPCCSHPLRPKIARPFVLRPAVRLARAALQAAYVVSDDLGTSFAERLFTSPRRHTRPDRERAVLATGRRFTIEVALRSPRWAGARPPGSPRGGGASARPSCSSTAGRAAARSSARSSRRSSRPASRSSRSMRPGTATRPGSRLYLTDHADAIADVAATVGPLHAIIAHSFGAAGDPARPRARRRRRPAQRDDRAERHHRRLARPVRAHGRRSTTPSARGSSTTSPQSSGITVESLRARAPGRRPRRRACWWSTIATTARSRSPTASGSPRCGPTPRLRDDRRPRPSPHPARPHRGRRRSSRPSARASPCPPRIWSARSTGWSMRWTPRPALDRSRPR